MNTLISLIVVVVVLAIIFWIIQAIGLPEPFGKIALVIVGLIAILWLLGIVGVVPFGGPLIR